MTSIEQVVAELAREPHLWWGYHSKHGWLVLDRLDGRNTGDSRFLIRCRDWSQFEVSRTDFSSDAFGHFKKHIASLPGDLAQKACDDLLALRRESTGRVAAFRVTEADLLRQRQEAWLEELR
jgi:hypothetical protein